MDGNSTGLYNGFLISVIEDRKKQTELSSDEIIFKNNSLNADSVLKIYGSAIYKMVPFALQKEESHNYTLFLESKIYSPAARKPNLYYCSGDSSLSVTLHNNYLSPDKQDLMANPTHNKQQEAVLLKYQ